MVARECGLVWGDYAKATTSNQWHWTVALLRELEAEEVVEQVRVESLGVCARSRDAHNNAIQPAREDARG